MDNTRTALDIRLQLDTLLKPNYAGTTPTWETIEDIQADILFCQTNADYKSLLQARLFEVVRHFHLHA